MLVVVFFVWGFQFLGGRNKVGRRIGFYVVFLVCFIVICVCDRFFLCICWESGLIGLIVIVFFQGLGLGQIGTQQQWYFQEWESRDGYIRRWVGFGRVFQGLFMRVYGVFFGEQSFVLTIVSFDVFQFVVFFYIKSFLRVEEVGLQEFIFIIWWFYRLSREVGGFGWGGQRLQ